ncbi:MAG: TolC family protein [Mariprofundaceae bacterium]|nr:TolC family protein [Mariprofundaceae bacterium]
MRIRLITVGMLLCMPAWQAEATTLQEAMDAASGQHPELRISEQSVEIARGQLTEQSSYAYNPELSLEPQRRRLNGGGTANDYYIGLSQGIELGGKRGYREQSAQQALNAAYSENELTQQQLGIGAARAFVELFFSKQVFNLRSRQRVMLGQLSQAIHRQMEAGEVNQLDLNLARAAFTSALSAEMGAKNSFTLGQAQYQMAIGEPGGEEPADPELPRLLVDWKLPENPFDIALQSRPDLAALRSRLAQSGARSDLASAGRIPDPTLTVVAGREAGENIVKVGLSFPIPLLNSHKGAYRSALAQASQAETRLEWSEKKLRLEVQAALYNHKSAMQAVTSAYQTEGPRISPDSIRLAQTAFNAGEMDLEELVIHINQALEAQLTTMSIMKQGWLARIRLAEVLGHPEYILEGTQK